MKPTAIFVKVEKERWLNRQRQLTRAFEQETYDSFGFVPNLGLSIHLNACLVLGNTTPECYFYHSTNKKFHDLTNGRSLPAAATSILGMGMKFIPTPQWTTHPDVVDESINRFECDLGLKVFFAGDEDITKTPEKL